MQVLRHSVNFLMLCDPIFLNSVLPRGPKGYFVSGGVVPENLLFCYILDILSLKTLQKYYSYHFLQPVKVARIFIFLPSWLKSEIFFLFFNQKKFGKMIRITFMSILSRPNLIHVSFRVAKMNLFSPSPLRGSGRKYHFCPPQADMNSIVPRQNGRKRSIDNCQKLLIISKSYR